VSYSHPIYNLEGEVVLQALTKYRRICEKDITLPEQGKIMVYRYIYPPGPGSSLSETSVGPNCSSNYHFYFPKIEGLPEEDQYWGVYTYYPLYKNCIEITPENDRIEYYFIDSVYVDKHLEVTERTEPYKEGRHGILIGSYYYSCYPDLILPYELEEFYGKPLKTVKIENNGVPKELNQFYWVLEDEITPDPLARVPLHPVLKYKIVQNSPDDNILEGGEEVKLYDYKEYDEFDNIKRYEFLGEVIYQGENESNSIIVEFGVVTSGLYQAWENKNLPDYDESSQFEYSDNWEVRKSYLYEWSSNYLDYEVRLCHIEDTVKKYKKTGSFSWELVSKAEFEYDNPSSLVNIDPNPILHDDYKYNITYNPRGNLTKKTEYINDDETRSQEYWYDICGNLVEMEDYMEYKYKFEYGPAYVFPDTIEYPDGSIEDFNFDKKGNLVRVTDKNNVSRYFEYDCYGRLTLDSISGGELLNKYQYYDFERWARTWSYCNNFDADVTCYYYDELGRLEKSRRVPHSGEDIIKEYFYDRKGNLNKETVPRFSDAVSADTVKKIFDVLNRVTEIEYPSDADDEIVEYEYNGNITDVIDEEENTTTLINDAAGNLIQVEDALGYFTDYYYDVNGNLDSIIDAEEKKTSFEYDWLGNLVKREGPDRGVDAFAYDANGNTIYHKNNAGDEIELEYDMLGRIEGKSVNNQEEETYYYDSYTINGHTYSAPLGLNYPNGRLTGFGNANVQEVYFYDKFGNLGEKLVIPLTEGVEEGTFEYTYDLKGRVTKLKYGDDYKVEYGYDNFGNISLVEINDEEIVNLSSTASGLLSGVHFPGEVTDTFTYLPRNWMESMHIEGVPDPYYTNYKEFYYNKRGELTEEKRGDPLELYASYQYDSLGRLTNEDREGEDNDHWFTYDKVGNRTIVNGEPYDYEMGTNKLRYIGQDIEYEYNDIGCISSKTNVDGTTEFFYNPEGRLIGVSDEDNNGYKYYYKGYQRIREEKLTDIVHNQTFEGFSYSCELKSYAIAEAKLIAVFLDENNDSIGNKKLAEINGTYNDWLEFSGNIPKEEFPSGTVSLKLRVKRSGMSPDGHLWVGDMSMGKSWGDGGISGDTVQANNYFYDNAGNLILVNSSGGTTSTNVIKNHSFETGDLSDWSGYGWSVTDQYQQEGEYSLYGAGYGEFSVYQEVSISEEVSSPITISCWIRANFSWGGGFELKGILKGDGINEEHSTGEITESSIGYWTEVSLTINDIPVGTSSCEIRLIRTSGFALMAVDNVICELETEEMTETKTKYIYAGNRLLAKEEDGELSFYHLDRLGSPVMITDEDGEAVKEKQYEAFGNLVWESDATHEDNREFTGKEKDPTGFHYFGARYYYGNIGRFLSPDPHTVMPGNIDLSNPQELNPYVYCVNDPLEYVDPNGKYYVWAWDFAINKTAAKGVPSSEIGLFLRDNTVPAVISGKGGLDAEVPFVKTLRPNIFKMDNQIEYLNYGPYTEIEGVGKRPFMSYQAAPGRGGLPMEVGAITKTGDTEKGTGKSIFEVQLETKVQNGWRRNDITLEREPKYDYQTNVTLTGTKDTFRSQGYEIYEDKDHPNNYGIRELQ